MNRYILSDVGELLVNYDVRMEKMRGKMLIIFLIKYNSGGVYSDMTSAEKKRLKELEKGEIYEINWYVCYGKSNGELEIRERNYNNFMWDLKKGEEVGRRFREAVESSDIVISHSIKYYMSYLERGGYKIKDVVNDSYCLCYQSQNYLEKKSKHGTPVGTRLEDLYNYLYPKRGKVYMKDKLGVIYECMKKMYRGNLTFLRK